MIDGDESAAMHEGEADAGIGNDSDGDAQKSERGDVNLGPGNEGTSTELKTAATEEAGGEEVAGSAQTKGAEVCSCFPAAHTQGAAALKGTVEEGR